MGATATYYCDICRESVGSLGGYDFDSTKRDAVMTKVKVQIGREPTNMEAYKWFDVCVKCMVDVKRVMRMES